MTRSLTLRLGEVSVWSHWSHLLIEEHSYHPLKHIKGLKGYNQEWCLETPVTT
jgi:hypothetical protein